VLTPEARRHPWFRRLSEELPDGRRLRVVENRLFDLLPPPDGLPPAVLPIGYDTEGLGGPQSEAVTMLEFARDRGGQLPPVFARAFTASPSDHGSSFMRSLLLFWLRDFCWYAAPDPVHDTGWMKAAASDTESLRREQPAQIRTSNGFLMTPDELGDFKRGHQPIRQRAGWRRVRRRLLLIPLSIHDS